MSLQPFSGNDYRKQVLSAVHRRGGVDESDSFELYSIPLTDAEGLTDAEVADRVAEVWAFWQKQRDHPKYRVLVERLVAEHPRRSQELLTRSSRIAEAQRVTDQRRRREEGRFELLDNAIERLMDRYGGIPASKRSGLDEIGAMGGLDPTEVATRLRRYRIINDAAPLASTTPELPQTTLSEQSLNQITELLEEFSRRRDAPPARTLLAVLDLSTDDITDREQITLRCNALRGRSRELPAGPMRAVIDELTIHIDRILLGSPASANEYRRAVMATADTRLRPHIRAAILVEDRLHPSDFQFLLEQARDLGLGTRDARRLIASVAAEYGGAVADSAPLQATAPTNPEPTAPTVGGDWQRSLRSARQALRKGNLDEARSRSAQARRRAGDDDSARRQIDAVDAEINRSVAATQPTPAAAPVPPDAVPGVSGPVDPAGPVVVAVVDGAVHVGWQPSPTANVIYRVARIEAGGRRQVVGRTSGTDLDDGGIDPSGPLPIYEVTAISGGTHSAPALSGSVAPTARPQVSGQPTRAPAPGTVPAGGIAAVTDIPPITDVVVRGNLVTFIWPVGVTEAMVVIRADAPPQSPSDPAAVSAKITNTRYQLAGGYPIPGATPRPSHVGVAACRRTASGALEVAAQFSPGGRARL